MAATENKLKIMLVVARLGVGAGIAIFVFGNQNTLLRLGGVGLAAISAYSFRAMRKGAFSSASGGGLVRNRPPVWMWVIAVGLLLALCASGLALYADAAGGYHDVFPVYAFTAIGLLCTFFLMYFVSRII